MWIASKGDAEELQESVHAVQKSFRGVRGCVNRWCAFEDDNAIGEIGCHDEIVLYNKSGFLGVKNEAKNMKVSRLLKCLSSREFNLTA